MLTLDMGMQAEEFAEKLDSLMEVTLSHLESAVDQGEGATLWPALLMVFQRTILRAHRCKFAQFLLWFLCVRVRPCCLYRGGLGGEVGVGAMIRCAITVQCL